MPILMPNQKPKEEKEDDFTKIMKGLQVGGQLFGIYADVEKIKTMKADNDLKAIERKRAEETFKRQGIEHDMKVEEYNNKKSGVLGPNEAAKFDISRQPGPGRVKALVNGEEVWIKERPPVQPNPIDREPKQNQFAAANYANRAQKAEAAMNALIEGGFNRGDRATAVGEKLKSLVGYEGQDFRKQEQAELDFLSAILRKESGANITDGERDAGAKQYFPRAGDGPEVLKQKAENRAASIAGLMAEGQPALGRVAAQQSALPPPKTPPQKPTDKTINAGIGLTPPKLSAEDLKALQWAQKNPNDPRAQAILQLHGKK